MNYRMVKKILRKSIFVLMAVLLMAAPSFAATVDLVALPATATMPGSVSVPMWGFALDTGQVCTDPPSAWAVGPALSVTAPDTSLTINLRNCLTEAVSIIIPGQTAVYQAPVFTTPDAQGRQRATSFTAVAAANGGMQSYTWNNLKPGTYLYQSGSHPAVQVQMGLYGALQVYPGTGQAYGPSTAYTTEVTLLYSEIDPTLHAAVAGGTYGTPPGPTSTLDYKPEYFLINGQPFQAGQAALPAGNVDATTLIRFLNAGLRSHTPTLLGSYLKLIAEDGNLYPYSKEQYSLLLAAGKTIDALWAPACGDTYKLYDHSLYLTTGGQPGGGMLAYLQVGGTACSPTTPPANQVPTANAGGPYTGTAGVAIAFNGTGSSDPEGATLTYSWNFGDGSPSGSGATPSHTYATAGPFTVTLTVNDGFQNSAPSTATATIQAMPIHIGDLDGGSANIGGNRWRAFVSATVHNGSHVLVPGAVVTGTWNAGDTNGRVTQCTADATGSCSVQSGRLNRNNNLSVTFTVNSVTKAGATYQSVNNHDPDVGAQASTGTSITVPRP